MVCFLFFFLLFMYVCSFLLFYHTSIIIYTLNLWYIAALLVLHRSDRLLRMAYDDVVDLCAV